MVDKELLKPGFIAFPISGGSGSERNRRGQEYDHSSGASVVAVLAVLFLLFPVFFSGAQSTTTDKQLAAQYFQKGDFEKAAMYYKKLYEEKGSDLFYEYYRKSLVKLGSYEKARSLVKDRMEKERETPEHHIDLGHVLKEAGKDKKAKKEYQRAVEMVGKGGQKPKPIAEKFLERDLPRYALKVYKKAKERSDRRRYQYNFEMAKVFGIIGEHRKMIEEYLDLLLVNRAYLQSVQNHLHKALDFDKKSDKTKLMKKVLLQRVQEHPDKEVFSEMLIWLYMQHGNYRSAFVQARALDKRKSEGGKRVFRLARTCKEQRAWDVAIDCYEYLIDKGRENPYYMQSRTGILEVMNERITSGPEPTPRELDRLERNYQEALEELGKKSSTTGIMKDLAHLKAFYLHEPDEAAKILRDAIGMPGLDKEKEARLKLELADVLKLKGEVWDASLYYSQVEKSFKNDKLGHKAKLENARLSFYNGDFEWAQAQLDVLKASTSKVIANDAMELSLLISDNYNLDTTTKPMELYAEGDLLIYQRKYEKGLEKLDSIRTLVDAEHSLLDEILYQKYKVSRARENYKEAASYLRSIIEEHGDDILADNAIFELAQMEERVLNNKEKAKDLYQKILVDHPGSIYTVKARKNFRRLRGDKVN